MKLKITTLLLLSIAAFAGDHSALNGTWKLIPTRSDFAGQPVVQTGTVTIADSHGAVAVNRSFTYEGVGETYFFEGKLFGAHGATAHEGKDLKSKASWDHDALVVKTTRSGVVTTERYTLAADGLLTATVVTASGKPITLLFERL